MLTLPSSSDLPVIWFEEPPKVVSEDVLVLGMTPPPEAPAGDQAGAEPAPVTVVVIEVGFELPSVSAAPLELIAAAPVPAPAGAVLFAVETETVGPEAAPEPEGALPPAPTFEVPPEDAFPTLADLDAILAANAGPPPEPSAAERAEVIAILGLDPALADDPVGYAETLANLPEPDADQVLEQWMRDYDVGPLSPEVPDPGGDWQIG